MSTDHGPGFNGFIVTSSDFHDGVFRWLAGPFSLLRAPPSLPCLWLWKSGFFPWMTRYKQRGGWKRLIPLQGQNGTGLPSSLYCPFKQKNEWSTTAMIKEPCEAFAFENKSFTLVHVPWSRNEPEVKKHEVLLRVITEAGNQKKTPDFTCELWHMDFTCELWHVEHFVRKNPSLLRSSPNKALLFKAW